MKAYITYVWSAGLLVQFALVIVLLANKIWRKFPIFSVYFVYSFLTSATLYFIRENRSAYFYTYWICEAAGLILAFGVVYEIFKTLLFSYTGLRRLANVLFLAGVLLFIGLAVVVRYAQPSGEQNTLMAAVLIGEESTRIVEVGLLMLLFAFSSTFGLHWRQHAFGIALGLGLFSAVELIAVMAREHVGYTAAQTFAVIRIVAYSTSLLIWLGYLLAPERVTSECELPKRAQLEQWNQAITELIHQ